MIVAKACSLIYKDGTEALKPFDLNINANEMVYVTGPSGSGKTSLMKLIMGIATPTQGSFEVLGLSMKEAKPSDIQNIRRNIGPIFQEFRLVEGRSVLDNIYLGMRFIGFSNAQMKKNALWALERVGLEHKKNHRIDKLSWGERQRVAIARAVARHPKLIIADEPTGNLDHENAVNIMDVLLSFKSSETAVVVTTHATHLIQPNSFDKHVIINAGFLDGGYYENKVQ